MEAAPLRFFGGVFHCFPLAEIMVLAYLRDRLILLYWNGKRDLGGLSAFRVYTFFCHLGERVDGVKRSGDLNVWLLL